jgi:hypothetical protein
MTFAQRPTGKVCAGLKKVNCVRWFLAEGGNAATMTCSILVRKGWDDVMIRLCTEWGSYSTLLKQIIADNGISTGYHLKQLSEEKGRYCI